MLHIAFAELPPGGTQEMRARRCRIGQRDGHAILQLIAKSVGTARLIEGRARPDPTGQGLVEQPTVHHDVQRSIGRLDADRAEQRVPMGDHRRQGGVQVGLAIAPDQRLRFGRAPGVAEQDGDGGAAARLQLDLGLQRGARVEAGLHSSGKRRTGRQRRRAFQAAVPAEELAPIASDARLSAGKVSEGDA